MIDFEDLENQIEEEKPIPKTSIDFDDLIESIDPLVDTNETIATNATDTPLTVDEPS